MQKRESFFVTVIKQELYNWQPAPRECASLTTIDNEGYLVGGLNYDVNKEVARLSISNLESSEIAYSKPSWHNVTYDSHD